MINIYTLRNINSKFLEYSTGNYSISYSNYNGKESKIYMYVCIYVQLNYFAVHFRLTQHCN